MSQKKIANTVQMLAGHGPRECDWVVHRNPVKVGFPFCIQRFQRGCHLGVTNGRPIILALGLYQTSTKACRNLSRSLSY